MPPQTTNDPYTLALSALTQTLADERRARRFLDLTGIGTDELRRRAGDADLLAALIGFLEAHEPDLVAVARRVGVTPEELVASRQALDKGGA